MPRPLLEVAVETPADALAAAAGGADRLELCSALALGGLTPSPGVYQEVRRAVPLPVVVMIRPRPGDFCYTAADFRAMAADVRAFLPLDPDGFAFGALNPLGDVDPVCEHLVRSADPVPCVFHRAFDRTRDPLAAADRVRRYGFTRVLTSGRQDTALAGADLIRQLCDQFPTLEWLPGGRVRAENVSAVLALTGCDQIHGAFTQPVPSDPGRTRTGRDLVAAARRAMDAGSDAGPAGC